MKAKILAILIGASIANFAAAESDANLAKGTNLRACTIKVEASTRGIQQRMTQAITDKKITPANEAEYKKLEAERQKDWDSKQKSLTAATCLEHFNLLEIERKRVDAMIPAVGQPSTSGPKKF